jgi:hypothetical protein
VSTWEPVTRRLSFRHAGTAPPLSAAGAFAPTDTESMLTEELRGCLGAELPPRFICQLVVTTWPSAYRYQSIRNPPSVSTGGLGVIAVGSGLLVLVEVLADSLSNFNTVRGVALRTLRFTPIHEIPP